MIKASIDRPKLERSLKRFAKDFGDTNAQAICRWGVQTCRELAGETLPWKTKGNPRTQHKTAIERDLGRVVFVMQSMTKAAAASPRTLKTAQECVEWMNENRGKNNRTKKLPPQSRKQCSPSTFKQAVRLLMNHAGIAKGGFLGAGMEIAKAQKGADRISIGKNLFSYAQKHSRFGSATRPRSGFSPTATLTNRASHTGLEYVLKTASAKRAIDWSLKKTVTWYRSALRRQDKAQKV